MTNSNLRFHFASQSSLTDVNTCLLNLSHFVLFIRSLLVECTPDHKCFYMHIKRGSVPIWCSVAPRNRDQIIFVLGKSACHRHARLFWSISLPYCVKEANKSIKLLFFFIFFHFLSIKSLKCTVVYPFPLEALSFTLSKLFSSPKTFDMWHLIWFRSNPRQDSMAITWKHESIKGRAPHLIKLLSH